MSSTTVVGYSWRDDLRHWLKTLRSGLRRSTHSLSKIIRRIPLKLQADYDTYRRRTQIDVVLLRLLTSLRESLSNLPSTFERNFGKGEKDRVVKRGRKRRRTGRNDWDRRTRRGSTLLGIGLGQRRDTEGPC